MENDIWDKDEALSRMDGDGELLRELAVVFLENYQAQLTGIQNAIARNDSKALESTAHDIKGSVGVFCAKPALEAALKLEIMGREHYLAGAQKGYTTLKNEVERLRLNLEAMIRAQ